MVTNWGRADETTESSSTSRLGCRRFLTLLAALAIGLSGVMALPAPPAEAAGTVLFGANPGGLDDGRRGYLTNLEDQIGRELDVVRVFEMWDSPFPTAYHTYVAESDRTMILSVRARRLNGTYVSWRAIADAQPGSAIHANIVRWVEAVRDLNVPVSFTFNHEPEVWENQANGVAADFVDAWRRFIDEFRSRNVGNVEFVWIMTDYSFHVPSSDRRHAPKWYPGDAHVDHIAGDAYNWHECRTDADTPWWPLAYIIEPMRVFGQAHPDKGLMLTEWASTELPGDGGAAKAAWIAEAAALFKQPGYEQFELVSYFNQRDNKPENNPCNFPVDSSQASLDAFIAMAGDPFYGGEGNGGNGDPPSDVILTGTADASSVAGPRWWSVTYVPASTGLHQFVLDWTGGGMLRIDVRHATTGEWLGADVSQNRPKLVAVTLQSGQPYRVAVWSMSGIGVFTVTVTSPAAPDAPPSVTLTAPAAGATVFGPVSLIADAADDFGVTEVEFAVDGASVGVDGDGSDGWSVLWDSTSVADGPAVVRATATDTGGHKAFDEVTIEVDNIDDAPVAMVVSPGNGELVGGSNVPITAEAVDDVGVTQVAFTVDGVLVGTDTNPGDGWSTTWDSTSAADGVVVIEATATDTAGQTGSGSVSVTIDNTGPSLTITSPADGSTVSGVVSITADAADATGVSQVEFFVDGSRIASDSDGSDGWGAEWNTAGEPDLSTPTVTATATDRAGNSTSDAISVTVDNTAADLPPTVTLDQPAAGATVSGTGVLVAATATDDEGVAQVEFLAGATSLGTDANGADGWSVSWDTTVFPDGPITVTATATDTIGQTASDQASVTIDNAPPPTAEVILTGIADASGAAGLRWQSVLYRADATGSHTFDLDWTGDGMLRMDVRRASDNLWIAADTSSSRPKSITTSLEEDTTYRVAVWAMSGVADFELSVTPPLPSDAPPSVTILTPADGTTVAGANVTLSAAAGDDIGVTHVTFRVNGSTVGTDTTGGDGWSVSWDSTTVSDGPALIRATATDTVGQTAFDEVTVTVDNIPSSSDVLFVVGNGASPNAGEQALVARMQGLGFGVVVVDDDSVTTGDASGKAVVVVSATTSEAGVSTKFRDVPEPVIIWKPWLYDSMQMSTTNGNNRTITQLAIVDSSHPLAAGFSGSVTVMSPSDRVAVGTPAPGATVVATAAGEPTLFVFSPGDPLANGTPAPGCRIAYPLFHSSATSLNANGWTLFDNAMQWAAASCAQVPVPNGRPNILIINTDDQRADFIDQFDTVTSRIGDLGIRFTNGYVTTPACCPSRAALLSGRYDHNNGQIQQDILGFDLDLTLQRYLKDAGYLTGHAGKFIHWVNINSTAPHWDRWTYFKANYYDEPINFDGTVVTSPDYTTHVVFERAIDYLDDFAQRNDSQPWFIYLAPYAPHRPYTPEPKYVGAPVEPYVPSPGALETDRSDKAPWLEWWTHKTWQDMVPIYEARIRTLYSVDEQVGLLLDHMEATGEMDNTLIIYTSDNGFILGEHGTDSKFLPFLESVSVPFMMRWDGVIAPGQVDDRLVANIDIAPTALAAAGVPTTALVVPMDGVDILSGHDREVALMEYWFDIVNRVYIPDWQSIRTHTYQYTRYADTTEPVVTDFAEYYDLVNDPYQLVNLLADGDPANDPDVATLDALLTQHATCAGTECH